MAFTVTAGGSWDDSRGQTYRYEMGKSDTASGTYYRHPGSNTWMTYEEFWKDVKRLQERVKEYIRLESQTATAPKPVVPISGQDDWSWNMEPTPAGITPRSQAPVAGFDSRRRQMDTARDVVSSTASSLTDTIPRPATAQATPKPVSRYKMKKHRGKFTVSI